MRDRLAWMLAVTFVLLSWVPSAAEPEPDPGTTEPLHRVVLHLSSGERPVQQRLVDTIRTLYQELGRATVQVELVASGPGVTLLIAGHTAFASELATLKEKYGLEYTACSDTMKAMGLTRAELIEQVDRTEPAPIRIIELAEQGWVYIKP